MKVTGIPVPEPSTWLLLALGGATLAVAATGRSRRRAGNWLALAASVGMVSWSLTAPAAAAPARLGIMGDSLSAGNGSAWGQNPNWHTQLTSAGSATVVVNAAFGGAETPSLPSQRASIIPRVQAGDLDCSILMIGTNDIVFNFGPDIVVGGDPNPFFDTVTSNVEATLDAVAAAGSVRQIVVNIPNAALTPAVQEQSALMGITPEQLQVGVAAAREANDRVRALAFVRGIPVVDLFAASEAILPSAPLELAGVSFPNLFAPDDFHPASVVHGLIANLIFEAANRGYGDSLAPLSDQEIVQNAGQAPLVPGPTYFDLSPYVLVVPEPSALALALTGFIGLAAGGVTLIAPTIRRFARRRGRSHGSPTHRSLVFGAGAAILMLGASVSLAVPTGVVHEDFESCDPLLVPEFVHELGTAPTFSAFPDELIWSTSTTTQLSACPATDRTDTPNALVEMTNLTSTPWQDVWYVTDGAAFIPPFGPFVGTIVSNGDGFLTDASAPHSPSVSVAFRIDAVGVNRPLAFESLAADGIFAPGETWQFILDDYFNGAGLPASLFDSIGVAGGSFGGIQSSGSIIAVPVPEPSGLVVAALGVIGFLSQLKHQRRIRNRTCGKMAVRRREKAARIGYSAGRLPCAGRTIAVCPALPADPMNPSLRIGPIELDFPVVQAALSGYSDWAMRVIARRLGAPYTLCEVMLDRFVGEVSKGRKARRLLRTSDEERPVGAQLMGANPEDFGPAAEQLVAAGFDVVDINFGCPVKKVLGRQRGGYLLGQVDTALEIVARVREAVPPRVPVTVKMRRGLDDSAESRDKFFRIFDGAYQRGAAAITVHGRTVQQRYIGPSRWEFLREAKQQAGKRVVLGSGDLFTPGACLDMIRQTGVDGVTAARGAIGNPWIFGQARALAAELPLPDPPSVYQQRDVIAEHYRLAEELYGPDHCGRQMRKFGIKYSRLHPQAMQVRDAFVKVSRPGEWKTVLEAWYAEDQPGRHPAVDADELEECRQPASVA